MLIEMLNATYFQITLIFLLILRFIMRILINKTKFVLFVLHISNISAFVAIDVATP